jgi:hypothetical protein
LHAEGALDVAFDLSSGFWLSTSSFAFSSGFWLLVSGLKIVVMDPKTKSRKQYEIPMETIKEARLEVEI